MHRALAAAGIPLPLRSPATASRRCWCRFVGLAAGILLLLPAYSRAQDLVAAASKERERRREVGKPSRTITERDLALARPAEVITLPPMEAPPATSAASAESAEQPEALSEEEEREDSQYAWRQMRQNALDDVARVSTEVERLQASLGSVSGLYGSARAERIAQLEKAKRDLAAARRVVEELESLGRQHGYR
jgi:hypothetical protein